MGRFKNSDRRYEISDRYIGGRNTSLYGNACRRGCSNGISSKRNYSNGNGSRRDYSNDSGSRRDDSNGSGNRRDDSNVSGSRRYRRIKIKSKDDGRISKCYRGKRRESRREVQFFSPRRNRLRVPIHERIQGPGWDSNPQSFISRSFIMKIIAKLDIKDPYDMSIILGSQNELLTNFLRSSSENLNRLTRCLENLDIAFKSEITPECLLNIVEAMKETEFISTSVASLQRNLETVRFLKEISNNIETVCALIRIVTRVCKISSGAKTLIFASRSEVAGLIDVIRKVIKDKQRLYDTQNESPVEEIPENENMFERKRSDLDECNENPSKMLPDGDDVRDCIVSLGSSNGDSANELAEKMTELTSIKSIQKLFTNLELLFESFEHTVKECTMQSNKNCVHEQGYREKNSGEKFRDIPVFPRIGDVNGDIKPCLRINKAKGGYESVDDYLDVQFRLLREDFVEPFREGIHAFKQRNYKNKSDKLRDIKVYEKTKIISPFCGNGVNHILSFDISNLGHVRWNISKRLKFGSLVCLTADNFETCYFASIVDSDTRLRRKGRLHVKFVRSPDQEQIGQAITFTMIESSAYFEAYRPVLCSLKTIMDGNFPFQKYIINCQNEESPPKYLLRNTSEMKLNLQCLLQPQVIHEHEYEYLKEVEIFKSEWPLEKRIPLDVSQLNALKSALTRDFTLIQGPPGCGKTHIGLMIAKVLLLNKHKWRHENGNRSQMLVVCYTNHALDQFMEGICSFYTGKLIRVGGRSRDEALDKLNLKNIKQEYRKNKEIPKYIQQGRSDALEVVIPLKLKLNLEFEKIKVLKENIVHVESLYTVMMKKHRNQFERFSKYCKSSPLPLLGKSCIFEWLGISSTKSVRKHTHIEQQKSREKEIDNAIDNLYDDKNREAMIDTNFDGTNLFDEEQKEELRYFREQNLAFDFNRIRYIDLAKYKDKERKIAEITGLIKHLKCKLKSLKPMSKSEALSVEDIICKEFTEEKRWALYQFWVQEKCNKMQYDMKKYLEYYEKGDVRLKEVELLEELYILRNSDVIGMTTTGAAIHKKVLSVIKPTIMIVEEAAEVLESHLVSSLTEGCEQLVMIGDHKQLKPKPNVYRLERDYNLNLSLFERMVRNGMKCDSLKNQHRMRPEIADNVRMFYESLEDHESVTDYEEIKGVSKNVFFIDHCVKEMSDGDLKSYSNDHEAEYMIALCNYFLLQGYDASNITILTTYNGQWYLMKKKIFQNSDSLKEVKLTVVDNYQGEENDIILLSLVRSNTEGKIGYVAKDNRICVALSRAKKGLYIIGNRSCLQSGSGKWKTIIENMSTNGFVGEALHLHCQNHPEDDGIMAKSSEDFKNAPEGGCQKICDIRLECGHSCEKRCHIKNKEHKNIVCFKPCTKKCANGHQCQKICHQTCYCEEEIVVTLPKCGHVTQMKCSTDIEKYDCLKPCKRTLECGHICGRKCMDKCVCMKPTDVKLKCGHDATIPCSVDPAVHKCNFQINVLLPGCGHFETVLCRDLSTPIKCSYKCGLPLNCGHSCEEICGMISISDIELSFFENDEGRVYSKCLKGHVTICKAPCNATLKCGHTCTGTCSKCFQGRWHALCKKNCHCILICGHTCKGKCGFCLPCTEKCQRKCSHTVCRRNCYESCIPCTCNCMWKCKHFACTAICGKICNRPRCDYPCDKLLNCKHRCIGMCGDPCPIFCRVCDRDKMKHTPFLKDDTPNSRYVQLQDCKHIIEYKTMDKYMDVDEGSRLKRCPLCNDAIWNTYGNRYENIVNRIFIQINEIRRFTVFDTKLQHILMSSTSKHFADLTDGQTIFPILARPLASSQFDLSAYFSILDEPQTNFLTFLSCFDDIHAINYLSILSFIKSISKQKSFLLNEEIPFQHASLCFLSQQRIHEIEREVKRFLDKCQLRQLKMSFSKKNMDIEHIELFEKAYYVLTKKGEYSKEDRKLVQEYTNQLPGIDSVDKNLINLSFKEDNVDRDAVLKKNYIDINYETAIFKETCLKEKAQDIFMRNPLRNNEVPAKLEEGFNNLNNEVRNRVNKNRQKNFVVNQYAENEYTEQTVDINPEKLLATPWEKEDGEIFEAEVEGIKVQESQIENDRRVQLSELSSFKEDVLNFENIEDGEVIEELESENQEIISNDRLIGDEMNSSLVDIDAGDMHETLGLQADKSRYDETTLLRNTTECQTEKVTIGGNSTNGYAEGHMYVVKILRWPGVPYFHNEKSIFDVDKLKEGQAQRYGEKGTMSNTSKYNSRKRSNDKDDKKEPLIKKMRKEKNMSFEIRTKPEQINIVATPHKIFDNNTEDFDKPCHSMEMNSHEKEADNRGKKKSPSRNEASHDHYALKHEGAMSSKDTSTWLNRKLVAYDDFEIFDECENQFDQVLVKESKAPLADKCEIKNSGQVLEVNTISKKQNSEHIVTSNLEPREDKRIIHTRVSSKLSGCDKTEEGHNCTERNYNDTEMIQNTCQDSTPKDSDNTLDLRNKLNKTRREYVGCKKDIKCHKGLIKRYYLRNRLKAKHSTYVKERRSSTHKNYT